MAELKTKRNEQSVTAFLDSIPDEKRRQDAFAIIDLMRKVTGEEPQMWGDAIIGFGYVHLRYESGRELDWFPIGFSPRKQNLTLYLSQGAIQCDQIISRLGKFKTGKGCLYINRLSDVDTQVLEELVRFSLRKDATPPP
jgi:hypothetical protein